MANDKPREGNDRRRSLYGRALTALLAAQSNWAAVHEIKGEEREVIDQWAATARVNLAKADAKSRAKLLDTANNALISVALGSTSSSTSNEKLGNLGLLRPDSYDLEISKPLSGEFQARGVSKSEVINCVRYPDAYQHFSSPEDFQKAPLISLFVKVQNRDSLPTDQKIWTVVIGRRDGRKLIAFDGYRISQSDLLNSGNSPLDLFKAFCEVYGFEVMMNQKSIGKFLLYARVAGSGALHANVPPKSKGVLSSMFKIGTDGFIEIAFAYAIDLTAFERSLRA